MRLEITAPTRWLSANHREHWAPKNRDVQVWRRAAEVAALSHCGPLARGRTVFVWHQPVAITATVHKSRGGRWDAHNLMPTVKACIDGLVDARVLADDSNEFLTFVGIRAGEVRKPAQLVLEVSPA